MISEIMGMILPPVCDICGKLADADRRMTGYAGVYRKVFETAPELHICGKCLSALCPQDTGERWFLCLSEPYATDPIPAQRLYIPFPYEGSAGRMVSAFKFGGKKDLARLAGILTGSLMAEDGIAADIVIPVPLSSGRLRERGYNQAAEIAKPVSSLLGIAFAPDALIRKRNTGKQSELKLGFDRYDNVRNAFEVSDAWDVEGLTVILTDDVATTGFTMHEAAVALYEAGAAKVLCAAFAGNRLVKNAEPF